MRRHLLPAIAVVLLLFVAGWVAVLWASQKHEEDVFGIIYMPFAQRSPEELDQALRSVPSPKPGPLLSVEMAQQHLSFKLALIQCSELAKLNGVLLAKEVFPDGSAGRTLTQVLYQYEGKEIKLVEQLDNSDDNLVKPNGAQEIAINGKMGFLLTNWVPDRIEVWWRQDTLRLGLWADKSIPPDALIWLAECVR